jgi:hypothetical protein
VAAILLTFRDRFNRLESWLHEAQPNVVVVLVGKKVDLVG